MDDDITSESEVGSDVGDDGYSELLKDNDMEETAAEKKLRLAKSLLAEKAKFTEDLEGDLEREALEKEGRLAIPVAENILEKAELHYEVRNAHKSSITCSCTYSSSNKEDSVLLYTASKKSIVNSWDITNKRKEGTVKLQDGIILSVACNQGYLVAGMQNGSIHVLERTSLLKRHTFLPNKGVTHKGAINGLTFRLGSTATLYSASEDRTVKVWDLAINSYVETLYGHQAGVQAVDALHKERCISVGGR